MRLDKFLKVSRLIRRRPLAKEICDAGRVEVNGRTAKAATEVKPGDRLTIGLGAKQLRVEVVELAENVPAHLAKNLYRVLE